MWFSEQSVRFVTTIAIVSSIPSQTEGVKNAGIRVQFLFRRTFSVSDPL